MSQDSFSAGAGAPARWDIGVTSATYNDLVRTIEDIDSQNGNEVYLYANPGEGAAQDALIDGDVCVHGPESRGNTTRCSQRSVVLPQLVHGKHCGAASGNYSGPELGRYPHADARPAYGRSQQAGRIPSGVTQSTDLDDRCGMPGHLNPQGRLATDRPP
jgi:hypothetical protein